MAKNKKEEKIRVKSPKIGSKYYFAFAGSIVEGTLDSVNEKMTEYYGHKWFTFTRKSNDRVMSYPVSIYNIASTYEELRNY